jgi:hypothetical protein
MSRHKITVIAAIFLAAAIVAGCTAGGPGSGQPPGAGTASPERPGATATPAPTPTPVEVLFRQRLAKATSASGSISGTTSAGSRIYPIEGTFAFDGQDSRHAVVYGTGKDALRTEQVIVGGHAYTRSGTGPWVRQEPEAGLAGGGTGVLGELMGMVSRPDWLRELEADGQVVRNGRTLTRLVVPGDAIDSTTLRSMPEGARASDVEVAFYAEKDGSLGGLTFEVAWSRATPDGATPMSIAIELLVEQLPSLQNIERPADVWVLVSPPGAGYSFASPEAWDVEPIESGILLDGGADRMFIFADTAPSGVAVEEFAEGSLLMIRELGGRVTASDKATVAGVAARVVSFDAGLDGVPARGIAASFVASGRGYNIFLLSQTRSQAGVREFLDQFLATFQVRREAEPSA